MINQHHGITDYEIAINAALRLLDRRTVGQSV
jgi:hypothetical protein